MDIALLKKEIRYRARRGLKETDLIFERFMNEHLDDLSVEELLEFKELLLVQDDQTLLHWFVDGKAPESARTPLFIKIQSCTGKRDISG